MYHFFNLDNMMKQRKIFQKPFRIPFFMLLAMVVTFSACKDDDDNGPIIEDPTGSLIVEDQFVAETNNMIVLEQVTLSQDGWVVVRRDNGSNAPLMTGEIISEPEFLEAGTHTDVTLELQEGEELAVDEQVWVILHADTGEEGVFEFEGEDTPDQPILDSSGNIVMASLTNSFTFDENTENVSYPLVQVDGSGINGTATFFRAERSDGAYVVLDVEGTPAGGNHPAHIHDGTAGSGGPIAVPLNNVDGDDGRSVTFVDEQSYDELLVYNGYVNIHVSPDDLYLREILVPTAAP